MRTRERCQSVSEKKMDKVQKRKGRKEEGGGGSKFIKYHMFTREDEEQDALA